MKRMHLARIDYDAIEGKLCKIQTKYTLSSS